MDKNFWLHKKLSEFSEEEWEAVCMRCGKCCLSKHEENGRMFFSNQMCDGFDMKTGRCSRYKKRLCDECAKVDLRLLQTMPELLPETCAYRLLFDGKELPEYHPLVSGDRNSVHKAGKSVLSMPVVSCRVREQAMAFLMSRIDKLSFEDFTKKLERINERYPVVFLENYPIKRN